MSAFYYLSIMSATAARSACARHPCILSLIYSHFITYLLSVLLIYYVSILLLINCQQLLPDLRAPATPALHYWSIAILLLIYCQYYLSIMSAFYYLSIRSAFYYLSIASNCCQICVRPPPLHCITYQLSMSVFYNLYIVLSFVYYLWYCFIYNNNTGFRIIYDIVLSIITIQEKKLLWSIMQYIHTYFLYTSFFYLQFFFCSCFIIICYLCTTNILCFLLAVPA